MEKMMQAEVEDYSNYINGSVYGYVLEDNDGEELDSCWGFYGFDWETNGLMYHLGVE